MANPVALALRGTSRLRSAMNSLAGSKMPSRVGDQRTPYSPDPGGVGGGSAPNLLLARTQAPGAQRQVVYECDSVNCLPHNDSVRWRNQRAIC
jgi:hypothetical protein